MLYAIIGSMLKNLEKRLAVRPGHRPPKALQSEGRLLLAGPFPAVDSPDPGPGGFSGSLIVAEFESQEAAEVWAKADPYATEGVFARVTVKPFKKVLPA